MSARDDVLTLEGYAEVLAHIRHFGKIKGAEVLERLAISDSQWSNAQSLHSSALVDASEAGDPEPGDRFGATFVETRARLAREQPLLETLGPRASDAASEQAAPPAESASAPEGSATSAPLESPTSQPFAKTALPRAPASGQDGRSPWAQGAASAGAPPSAAYMASGVLSPPAAVAFGGAGGAPILPSYLVNTPAPIIHSAPTPPTEDINATAELRVVPSGPALPFSKDAAPTPFLPPEEPKLRPSPRDPCDETASLPAILAVKPILPFGRQAAAPVPATPADDGTVVEPGMLTLAQYASLCAELATLLQPRATVLLRYGLADDAARTRQETYWARRMKKNDPLKAKYKELVTSFQEYLERLRRVDLPIGRAHRPWRDG